MTSADIIANVILAITLLGMAVFSFAYIRNARWQKYPTGRAMMWLMLAFGMILAFGFVNLTVPPYDAEKWIRVGLFANACGSVWHFVIVLFKELKIDPFYLLKIPRRRKKLPPRH